MPGRFQSCGVGDLGSVNWCPVIAVNERDGRNCQLWPPGGQGVHFDQPRPGSQDIGHEPRISRGQGEIKEALLLGNL